MAKIKGWKKTKERKYLIIYENVSSGRDILIVAGKKYGAWLNGWVVDISSRPIIPSQPIRHFKTKQEALRFATNYMKQHPRG